MVIKSCRKFPQVPTKDSLSKKREEREREKQLWKYLYNVSVYFPQNILFEIKHLTNIHVTHLDIRGFEFLIKKSKAGY